MSRSNPTDNTPNPAKRWFEWDGQQGQIRYYDKIDKKNVPVEGKFTFILLDQLSTIKGWHDSSQSGIFANEVRDTRSETFLVKAFKGGEIANGLYAHIRDKVKAAGGKFVTNLYVAFKGETQLDIGSVQFKGGALSAWMEFAKQHRKELYEKAVVIDGFDTGKKGTITFKTPKFAIKDISPETDEQARKLDEQLQEYLKGYFGRTRTEQAVAGDDLPPEPEHSHSSPDDTDIPW